MESLKVRFLSAVENFLVENLIPNEAASKNDFDDFLKFGRNQFVLVAKFLVLHSEKEDQNDKFIHIPQIIYVLGIVADDGLDVDYGTNNMFDKLLKQMDILVVYLLFK